MQFYSRFQFKNIKTLNKLHSISFSIYIFATNNNKNVSKIQFKFSTNLKQFLSAFKHVSMQLHSAVYTAVQCTVLFTYLVSKCK